MNKILDTVGTRKKYIREKKRGCDFEEPRNKNGAIKKHRKRNKRSEIFDLLHFL